MEDTNIVDANHICIRRHSTVYSQQIFSPSAKGSLDMELGSLFMWLSHDHQIISHTGDEMKF